MKKILTILLAVFLVFSVVSFVSAEDSDSVENVLVYDGDFKWVPGGLPWRMFIPHYDNGGTWWTGLVMHSLSINANQYTVSFCNNAGYVQSITEGALTGFQKVGNLLNLTNQAWGTNGCTTGWMVVESQFPMLGFVNFGITGVSVTTLGPFYSN